MAFSAPIPLANRAGWMFDMCVRLVPPRAVAVHTLHESYLV